MRRGARSAALVAVGVAWTSASAIAGTIRHDVSDSLYLARAAQSQYAAVGKVTSSGLLASGTLIARDWVLTAAHVVDAASSGSLNFTLGSQTYTSTEWTTFSGWDGSLGTGEDMALIHLSQSVSGVTPAQLYQNSDEVDKLGTIVGFGATGTGLTGATGNSGTKRAGENLIGGLGSVFGYSNNLVLADFDAPGSGSSDPKAISYPLEYMPAPGDSGGGLFVTVGGETFLAGVTSFISGISDGIPDASYSDVAAWTRVSVYYDWIDSIVGLLEEPLPGDLNGDGAVDIFDVGVISDAWMTTDEEADANGDGVVNIFDVGFVSEHWTGEGASNTPEPSALALAFMAIACGVLAWKRGLIRPRR